MFNIERQILWKDRTNSDNYINPVKFHIFTILEFILHSVSYTLGIKAKSFQCSGIEGGSLKEIL